jgi:SAM-dependent methyltransferase
VTEPWVIDELAHAGPEHLDPAFVAGYDRKQGHPDPAEDLAIFAAHGLGPASAVLDLGAGTGQFALAAARRFGQVTAVDVSPVFQSWFDHAARDPADGYTSADYAEHIRTEFSTFRWLLEPMLAATGFEIVTADYARRLYGAYTCIRRAA